MGKLKLVTSHERLDKLGLDYAKTHTVAELRSWLKRFVARVEPEGFNARADEERRKRSVQIVHGDDGMSWMTIYQSSHLLAAADNRLDRQRQGAKLGADPTMTAPWTNGVRIWPASGCWPTTTARPT